MANGRVILVLSALVAVSTMSCSGQGFLGRGSKSKGETNQTAPGDSEKPTDQSEGVPGYLTNPEGVDATVVPGKITFTAPAGSVTVDEDEEITDVAVIAWGTSESGDLEPVLQEDDGVSAEKLAQVSVEADGSFSVEAETLKPQVILTIGSHEGTPGLVPLKVGKSIVLKKLRVDGFVVRGNPQAGEAGSFLTAGAHHFCAISVAGKVACWGRNVHGGLGNGKCADEATAPVLIDQTALPSGEAERKFVSIDAGSFHTCGVTADSQAWCFGYNAGGALGDGGLPGDASDAECSPTARAVDVSGLPEADRKLSAVSAAALHGCAATATGKTVCWGSNAYGELGNGTNTSATIPTPISTATISGGALSGVVAGTTTSCGINSSGQLFCWGLDQDEELGNGVGAAPDLCDHQGQSFTCAKNPRAIDDFALGDKALDMVVGGTKGMLGRNTDGGWYCWGDNKGRKCGAADVPRFPDPVAVPLPAAGGGYDSVDSSDNHTCGIAKTGKVYCWGMADKGQLGKDAATDAVCGGKACSSVPQEISLPWQDEKAVKVAVGVDSACALSTTGKIACWGDNAFGQMGTGKSGAVSDPVLVTLPAE